MRHKNIFDFGVEWNYRTLGLMIMLVLLPNFLGMINISTAIGFKIHLFQYAVFLAAIIYGPKGGLLSGLFGSVYSAVIMQNPYIAVGNAILGFFTGLFIRRGMNTVLAAFSAFLIQLPWLVVTDHYLVGLPMSFIVPLVFTLAATDILWASCAHYTAKLKRFL